MSSYAAAERAALSDLFHQLGPGAPTLCAGWATADLAAHLVLRERRPDAAVGILAKPLAGYTQKVQGRLASSPYEQLVETFRSGPPAWSPAAKLPQADEMLNAVELFVHHEDARRAQSGWQPRVLDPELETSLWRHVARMGRLLYRRARVGVALRNAGTGEHAVARNAAPSVTVVGAPAELLLHAFGRTSHARVRVEGDPEAVRVFATTPLGA